VDTTEYTSAICWRCAKEEAGRITRCIDQMNVYTTGEEDHVDTEDMCLMLPSRKDLRLILIHAVDDLVKKVLE
jgi:hypothetical protein